MGAREFEVRTKDGRRLIAAVAGPEDGELVLHHHGSPGSHLMFDRHVEEGAERGLRHVSYSRPGYSGSDRRARRSYADEVGDAIAVADSLGVESFYAIGLSGGGGPALACAALVPDRVRSVVSASALGPRDGLGSDWLRGALPDNVREFEILEEGETELVAWIKPQLAEWIQVRTVEDLESDLDGYTCDADKNLSEGYQAYRLAACQAFGPTDLWGWFDDDWAMWLPWGFDLAAITVPATIWQGGQDRLVPPQNAEWLAANVPGATPRFFPEMGHMSLFDNHYGEMLDDLIASARS
ncbi:MAG TPA: alpha/beta hydrolase [Solirubrobacterales bacterium]|nr:alpha/beta hydrolase [Solirubrobacterales bacterium]